MRGQTSKARADKAKLGRLLFWVGSLVLLAESWLLITRVSQFWNGSGAATLGWMAGLGALVQRALAVLVWNQGLLLAALAKVLVLCCPLALVCAGIVILRGVNRDAERASMNGAVVSFEGEER
jgi:hypothetical protein